MAAEYHVKNLAATDHTGSVADILFCNQTNDFVILKLKDNAVVMGEGSREEFAIGTSWKFFGKWEENTKSAMGGMRFKFSTAVVKMGHTRRGVVVYLTKNCEGIGEKTAGKLYEKYGGAAVEMVRTNPSLVATETGIDSAVLEGASRELKFAARTENVQIELHELFSGRGFSGKLIKACIAKWHGEAGKKIRRNPFVILGMPSAGFKRCDRLWTDLGLRMDRLKRQAIVAANLIRLDNNGHTWLPASEVAAKLMQMIPTAKPKRCFQFALRAKLIKKYKDDAGGMWLATYARARAEDRVATAIVRLMRSPPRWPTELIEASNVAGDGLPSAHQVEQLKLATAGPVGLFTGSPGTGKTFSVAYLIRAIIAKYGESSIIVCAPTGKAANRASRALKAAKLGGIRARTIHTTLEIGRNGHDGDGWGFVRNRYNPLEAQFVIVDEKSMVDTTLLADLLDACAFGGTIPAQPELRYQDGEIVPPRCLKCRRVLTDPESWKIGYGPVCAEKVNPADYRDISDQATAAVGEVVIPAVNEYVMPGTCVLFVGDAGQLAPVGHGAPLRDLMKAGLPQGRLTEVRRNSGLIVHACKAIAEGKPFLTTASIDLGAEFPQNLKYLPAETPEKARELLLSLLGEPSDFNPVWDTQVIVAKNLKGELSRKAINDALQPFLNPEPYRVGKNPFAVRDKIICTRNGYLPLMELDSWADQEEATRNPDCYGAVTKNNKENGTVEPVEAYVANGEFCEVVAVNENITLARVEGGTQIVKIVMSKKRTEEEDDEGGESGESGNKFELGYAVTCHKMQGSEAPVVIIMADPDAGMVAFREWWYTAISRGAAVCYIIGLPSVVDRQRAKQAINSRQTFLRQILAEMQAMDAQEQTRAKTAVPAPLARVKVKEAWEAKYGFVTLGAPTFHPGEPVFLFRASDPLMATALLHYGELCAEMGCDEEHVLTIFNRMQEVVTWQRENVQLVKRLPD